MTSKGTIGTKSEGQMGTDQFLPQTVQQQPTNQAPPVVFLKEDDKMPLFLIKLWNIVEDPTYFDIIRWDDSGYSFHILDPYSFCRNILPQYFKHNNLNSLIRQLNMYGFRKMTPIERTSLARAESDQDHLEFSHPCFVRDHPELLVHIKRKTSHNKKEDVSGIAPPKDFSNVLEEIRNLRERQTGMEDRMNELINENMALWQQMDSMRATHMKQQQIVNKLVHFLVTLVQPKRLGKRHLLAIDEASAPKKKATGMEPSTALQTIQNNNINDILDNLISDFSSRRDYTPLSFGSSSNGSGPIISDVTDELEHLTASSRGNIGSNDLNLNYGNSIQQQQPKMTQQQPMMQQQNVIPQMSQSQRGGGSIQQVQNQDPTLGIANSVDEPSVLSPNAQGLPFTPTDFADYLSGVNQGIDNCRDLIGDQWNDFDFESLIDSTGESPEDHLQKHPLPLEQTHPVYSYSPSNAVPGASNSNRPSPRLGHSSMNTVQQQQLPQGAMTNPNVNYPQKRRR
ncbi:hypothetical protein FO519_006120 [Halicephalobus sp. NKZ332]|nr:hypothetical protein FO519_006120 [Halicephalobus sp. NKZ332]